MATMDMYKQWLDSEGWDKDSIASLQKYMQNNSNALNFRRSLGGNSPDDIKGLPSWAYQPTGELKTSIGQGAMGIGEFITAAELQDPARINEWKKWDPSFDPSKVQFVDHPLYGKVATMDQLPQNPDQGNEWGDLLQALMFVGGGALGISGLAGLSGMPGIGSLSDLGAAATTGLDAAGGIGGFMGPPADLAGSGLVDWGNFPADLGQSLGSTSNSTNIMDSLKTALQQQVDSGVITPDQMNTALSATNSSTGSGIGSTITDVLSKLPGNVGKAVLSYIDAKGTGNKFTGVGNDAAGKAAFLLPTFLDELKKGEGANTSLLKLIQDNADPNSPLRQIGLHSFGKANQLVGDPSGHSGYQLADTASKGLQNLYTDPMSNPLMSAVSNITRENTMRRSAAGRGLDSGSMPAELQDSLLASLAQNYSNIANPMNNSVNVGANWLNNDIGAATNLGTATTNAANNNIMAGSQGVQGSTGRLNAIANMSNPLATGAGLYANAATKGATQNPWASALYSLFS